ncbi:MAG: MFS transporter [Gemmatimonadetes bacterium]|nr:MFS transporter [Gemmatimonadota bacterium]
MRDTRLAVLFTAVLVDMVGFGIVLPLLPFYAEQLGASPIAVTLLVASFSASQLVASPLWGRVSDRRGRKPLLVAGLFASSLSYLIFGLANSLALLFLSRIAAGAAGATIAVAQAYVADTTSAEKRAHGIGLLGAASGLGVMLGPAIGGMLSPLGLGAPGFVAAGLCAANGVAALMLLPESRPKEVHLSRGEAATLRGWVTAMTRFPMGVLLGVYFLAISSFNAMTSVLALWGEREFALNAAQMGIVFTLAGGSTVLVRGVVLGRLVKRFGETRTTRIGATALALSLLVLPLVPNRWWLGALVPMWAFGAGTLFPSLATLVSQATDPHSQGSVLGGSQVIGGSGRVLGPVWAGFLFQHVSIQSPFLVGGTLVGLAGVLALRIPRRVRPPAPPTPAKEAAAAVEAARDVAG